MRDEHHGQAEAVLDVEQQVEELRAHRHVEGAGRLVGEAGEGEDRARGPFPDAFWAAFHRVRGDLRADDQDPRVVCARHEDILAALEAGDGPRAAVAMRAQLRGHQAAPRRPRHGGVLTRRRADTGPARQTPPHRAGTRQTGGAERQPRPRRRRNTRRAQRTRRTQHARHPPVP
ncbi:FCD domain-containing protein [Streptomyces sp. MS19]|uniref:FCD domain-containing protein n=1 Tax=Streptomyces sp. MS19 TaxID=3385972 RepID=UPI0039A0C052